MRTIRSAPTSPRVAVRRYLAVAAAAGVLLSAAQLPAGAASPSSALDPAAGGHSTWVVRPGQSIQAAVNRAKSGDTVKIQAGTYAEAVCVDHKGLKVVGAGADATILTVPAVLPTSACWVPNAPEGQPTENVSALKFRYPDSPVEVSDLQTSGHPESGIVAWGAHGFTVQRTKGVGHRIYGILATANSTDVLIKDNVEQGVVASNGRSGTAGISVGDSVDARAVIRDNVVRGTSLGIFVREARNGQILHNTVTGTCGGILVFDDSTTEKPTVTGTVQGGGWDVVRNRSVDNTRYCRAGRQGNLKVSGFGMAVVNADHVTVVGNRFRGNKPSVPVGELNFPAGGLALLTVPSPTGGPDPGPAEYVTVVGNRFRDNGPLDISLATPRNGDYFDANRCSASDPEWICRG